MGYPLSYVQGVVICGRRRGALQIVLARAHVRDGRLLTVDELRLAEPILVPVDLFTPSLRIGCTLGEALAAATAEAAADGGAANGGVVAERFRGERCIVTRGSGACWVALRQDAAAEDILRAIWQAAALDAGMSVAESRQAAERKGREFVAEVLRSGLSIELLSKEMGSRPRFEEVAPL